MWAGVFGADRAMSGRVNKCSFRRRKEEDYRPSIELVLGSENIEQQVKRFSFIV